MRLDKSMQRTAGAAGAGDRARPPGAEASQHDWWHVVWPTFRAWAPTDERGAWHRLAALYAELASAGERIEVAAQLPASYQGRPQPAECLTLSPVAREVVRQGLLDLAANDRLAGETAVRALAVGEHAVQALIACPEAALRQRVGRLKSRTATLLSFEPAAGCGGRGTWSRGFWWARLSGERAVEAAAAVLEQAAAASETPCDRSLPLRQVSESRCETTR